MEIIINIKSTFSAEIKNVIPSAAKKRLFYYMSAGLITDKIEVEQFPISTVLNHLMEIFIDCGVTDILNFDKDKEIYYNDTKNIQNDFRKVVSEFIDQYSWMYSKFYTTINFNLTKNDEKNIYLINVSVNREHIVGESPIRIRISAKEKSKQKNKQTEKLSEKITEFGNKVLSSVRKIMPVNDLKMDFYQVNNSIPYSLFEKNVDEENEFVADEITAEKGNFLFPLYNITLGKTTIKELAAMGIKSTGKNSDNEPYKFYVVNGMNFWYSDKFADSIYITNTDEMPKKWKDIGFSWNSSYNTWLKLLKNLGFQIKIKQEPRIVDWDNHPSFDAEVIGQIKTPDGTYTIELGFHYSKGTKISSFGTLYNLRLFSNN